MENIIIYMIATVFLILLTLNRVEINKIKKSINVIEKSVNDVNHEVFDYVHSSWSFFNTKVSKIKELRKFNESLINYLGVDITQKNSEESRLIMSKKKKIARKKNS